MPGDPEGVPLRIVLECGGQFGARSCRSCHIHVAYVIHRQVSWCVRFVLRPVVLGRPDFVSLRIILYRGKVIVVVGTRACAYNTCDDDVSGFIQSDLCGVILRIVLVRPVVQGHPDLRSIRTILDGCIGMVVVSRVGDSLATGTGDVCIALVVQDESFSFVVSPFYRAVIAGNPQLRSVWAVLDGCHVRIREVSGRTGNVDVAKGVHCQGGRILLS